MNEQFRKQPQEPRFLFIKENVAEFIRRDDSSYIDFKFDIIPFSAFQAFSLKIQLKPDAIEWSDEFIPSLQDEYKIEFPVALAEILQIANTDDRVYFKDFGVYINNPLLTLLCGLALTLNGSLAISVSPESKNFSYEDSLIFFIYPKGTAEDGVAELEIIFAPVEYYTRHSLS